MTSVTFDEIYSRFYTKAEAFDIIGADEPIVGEMMQEWLRSALFYPHIQKLFSQFEIVTELDDDTGEEKPGITFTMAYPINESYDREFVIDVLSYGMVYGWVQPKVTSITNVTQFFGETDSKFYSQATHLSELRALRNDIEAKIRGMIRDRGFFKNDYLDGTAASASLRN